MRSVLTLILFAALAAPAMVFGQSSSLYLSTTDEQSQPFSTVVVDEAGAIGVRSTLQQDPLAPALRRTSLIAVPVPAPRTYQMNDLVTIIVRESTTATIDTELQVEKDVAWVGGINEFPQINLADLLNLQLKPNNYGAGSDGRALLDVGYGNEFEGEGDYAHRNEMTARLAARVIDVKPNGLLVLEARKYIEHDKETMNLTVTGTCSVDSIGADNTVLSSEIYDLYVSKQTTGELKKTTKKGWLSKLMDTVFNF